MQKQTEVQTHAFADAQITGSIQWGLARSLSDKDLRSRDRSGLGAKDFWQGGIYTLG
jgi:hypothetical protein